MKAFFPDPETLSLAEQVAQMVVVRASGFLFDHQVQYPDWEPRAAVLQRWIEELGVGGVILLGASAGEIALRTQQLQDWATVPLLICADVEEGVGQRFSGATWFAPPMAIAAIAQHDPQYARYFAEQMGNVTAQEARAIGLNWLLAPTVDVNNNPNNPVINVRAFGETPQIVSELTTAFIRGAQKHAVLTTAKHFPGHGDTTTDSHLELPVISHDRDRLEQIELPPFKAAIAAGVDAIMSAHLQIPALDASYPGTLSPQILTRLLRETMGFDRLIVTDALVMGAIANQYGTAEASILAVEAGADILLMPLEPEVAVKAVCEAVESGRIGHDRIAASVARIWRAKQKVFPAPNTSESTHDWESTAPGLETQSLTSQLAQSHATITNTEILRQSTQIYKPDNATVRTASGRNLIVVDDVIGCNFLARTAPAIVTPAQFGFSQVQIVDVHTPSIEFSDAQKCPTLLQLFIRGNPFRGSAGVTQTAQTWFNFLYQNQQLQGLVIYGSPYVVKQLLSDLELSIPLVFSYGQTEEAQAIALRALFA